MGGDHACCEAMRSGLGSICSRGGCYFALLSLTGESRIFFYKTCKDSVKENFTSRPSFFQFGFINFLLENRSKFRFQVQIRTYLFWMSDGRPALKLHTLDLFQDSAVLWSPYICQGKTKSTQVFLCIELRKAKI